MIKKENKTFIQYSARKDWRVEYLVRVQWLDGAVWLPPSGAYTEGWHHLNEHLLVGTHRFIHVKLARIHTVRSNLLSFDVPLNYFNHAKHKLIQWQSHCFVPGCGLSTIITKTNLHCSACLKKISCFTLLSCFFTRSLIDLSVRTMYKWQRYSM